MLLNFGYCLCRIMSFCYLLALSTASSLVIGFFLLSSPPFMKYWQSSSLEYTYNTKIFSYYDILAVLITGIYLKHKNILLSWNTGSLYRWNIPTTQKYSPIMKYWQSSLLAYTYNTKIFSYREILAVLTTGIYLQHKNILLTWNTGNSYHWNIPTTFKYQNLKY